MNLKVTFEISDRDVGHFRQAMRRAREAVRDAEETDIIEAARLVMDSLSFDTTPDFVRERLTRLAALIAMLEDADWRLPATERSKLLSALVYFGDPEDLIPDHVPGLGYLDDAIMAELVLLELTHVIDAYRDFRDYRDNFYKRCETLDDAREKQSQIDRRRDELQQRMRRRARRDRDREAASHPSRLW